jgi:gamma-glutamylcyclotransferase (GGCT)/AIG2-like uncharacterized protein YtfP
LADKRTVDTSFIFVYGGLMRGFDLHDHIAHATFIGDGWTDGRLVVVGRYPGLVDGAGAVAGEIYRLEDAAADLEALDDLEDFDPANPEKSAYLRCAREVRTKDGSVISAWVYLYNADPSDAPVVTSGDWRHHPT